MARKISFNPSHSHVNATHCAARCTFRVSLRLRSVRSVRRLRVESSRVESATAMLGNVLCHSHRPLCGSCGPSGPVPASLRCTGPHTAQATSSHSAGLRKRGFAKGRLGREHKILARKRMIVVLLTPSQRHAVPGQGDTSVPFALTPIGHPARPILDNWWRVLLPRFGASRIFLVTCARDFAHYERWATQRGLPQGNVVNDGASGDSDDEVGSAQRVHLAAARAARILPAARGHLHPMLVVGAESLLPLRTEH